MKRLAGYNNLYRLGITLWMPPIRTWFQGFARFQYQYEFNTCAYF